MDPSAAAVAQALDELAKPPIVECVECGADIVLTNRARLYCSEVCRQTLKLIHYGRSVEADGRIERDPTIAEALQMRIAQILGGGYHERARQVPSALRAQIFERDHGRCALCGARATQIDHIAGDANTLENLRAACGECNLGLAQRRLVPAPPDKSALADELLERIFAVTPVFPRDDQTAWTTLNVGLIAERRGRLRAHIAVQKLLARAATAGGLRPA